MRFYYVVQYLFEEKRNADDSQFKHFWVPLGLWSAGVCLFWLITLKGLEAIIL